MKGDTPSPAILNATWICYSTSTLVNVIIYVFMLKEVRKVFWDIFYTNTDGYVRLSVDRKVTGKQTTNKFRRSDTTMTLIDEDGRSEEDTLLADCDDISLPEDISK